MEHKASSDRSPWWLGLAGIAGALVGAAITGGLDYIGRQGDVNEKMIELSIGILRAQPTPETMPLREWAIDTIKQRGQFSFTDAQQAVLLKKELPFVAAAPSDASTQLLMMMQMMQMMQQSPETSGQKLAPSK
jgi:hypothetical protein